MMENLNSIAADPSVVGQVHSSGDKTYTISKVDNFEYTDPVDLSVSKNQVSEVLYFFTKKLYNCGIFNEMNFIFWMCFFFIILFQNILIYTFQG